MKTLLILLMTISASMAEAAGNLSGVMLSFNGFMYNQTRDSGSSSGSDNLYIYDLKLGYITDSLYFGGIYTTRNNNGSAISGESGTATGVSAGYMSGSNFYLMGHYYLQAELGDYTGGSGYQVDFGYMANITGAFHAGVELTYRNIEYKDHKTNSSAPAYRVKELFPMFTAAFVF